MKEGKWKEWRNKKLGNFRTVKKKVKCKKQKGESEEKVKYKRRHWSKNQYIVKP
jgi:hypothetical protein